MNEQLTQDEMETLADLRTRSDWAGYGHTLLMHQGYDRYGRFLPSVHADHFKAWAEAESAKKYDMPLAVYQAARIMEIAEF